MKPSFALLILFHAAFARSQPAHLLGMGGAGLGLRGIYSALSNPAGLAYAERAAALVSAGNPFLAKEVRLLSGAGAAPAAGGVMAITLQHIGFGLYREQQAGLAYARRLSPSLAIGGQFLLLHMAIPDYGSRSWFSFELGMQADILPRLTLAVRLHNPVRQEVAPGEFLPSTFNAGLAWRPGDQLLLALEVEKDIDFPARARAGLEYRVARPLALRLGVMTQPAMVSFGAGIFLANGINADFASAYHPYLGFSPAAGAAWGAYRPEH